MNLSVKMAPSPITHFRRYPAVEAIWRAAGQIIPLEPVRLEENEHLVIVRMPTAAIPPAKTDTIADYWQHFAGLLKDSPNWNGDPQAVQEQGDRI